MGTAHGAGITMPRPGSVAAMLAILAVIAFAFAALFGFFPGFGVSLTVIVAIIAVGLALSVLHSRWPDVSMRR